MDYIFLCKIIGVFLIGIMSNALINKTTEGGGFAWMKRHLRLTWTAFLSLSAIVLSLDPQTGGIIMKQLMYLKPVTQYLIIFFIGGSIFCLIYWGAGKISKTTDDPVNVNSQAPGMKKIVREKLGDFLREGIHIQVRCEKNPPGNQTYNDFVKWCDKIRDYFSKELDSSYHARFENTGGVEIKFPPGMSKENTATWVYVGKRNKRLEEFIKENQ